MNIVRDRGKECPVCIVDKKECVVLLFHIFYILFGNLYLIPKRQIASNISCRFFWFRIIPCCVFIHFSTNNNMRVICFPFPWAGRMIVARFEMFLFYGFRREIMISFHNDCVVTFCNDCVVPDCFHMNMFNFKNFCVQLVSHVLFPVRGYHSDE